MPGKFGQVPEKKDRSPTGPTYSNLTTTPYLINQYNPCRGSSIGRACGSYDSKEINLKVVGSSPTFGYSYQLSSLEQLFFCSFAGVLAWWCFSLLVGPAACGCCFLLWVTRCSACLADSSCRHFF